MVSIIVPIYNAEKYLRECIESVIAQTFTDWELILVDDGSTDSSGKIADEYAASDSRIRVIHSENGGPGHARNTGIDASKGEYLAFVDADDCMFQWSVETLMDAIKKGDCDISVGNYISSRAISIPQKHNQDKIFFTNIEAVKDLLYQHHITSSPWGKIFSRHLLDRVRFEDYGCYEDLDFMAKALSISKRTVYVFSPLYFYRHTEGSLINTWSRKRLDVLTVTERLEDFMAEKHPELLPAAHDRRLSANFNIFVLSSRHGEKDVADRCWELIKNYRGESLRNPDVRLKNKAGILLSYLGKRLFLLVSRMVYM